MATMADVAKRAGVSTATVSRALNRPDKVDKETRAKVEMAIAALDYRPNSMAQGLAARSSRTIGCIVNLFDAQYFGAMLDAITLVLTGLGYKLIVESSNLLVEGERDAWLSLRDRQCDAIIVHSDRMESDELAEWMERYPGSVLLNRWLDGFGDRCVAFDDEGGAALAARHFLDHGHERMAMVTGWSEYHTVARRTRGFERVLEEAGRPLDPALKLEGRFRVAGGYDAMTRLLERRPRPTAVFLHNDDMLGGAMHACRDAGVRVPEDVSLIGFDDGITAQMIAPRPTSVRQPLRGIGASAAQLAYAMAANVEAMNVQRWFEATLSRRESVGPPPR